MAEMEFPDFHIPHAEKIGWMIETNGWALEAVSGDPMTSPPVPSYAYTIGVPDLTGFADIAVFGMKPAHANGLLTHVVEALHGGTEIPIGVELIGLLDNELRCRFAPIASNDAAQLFDVAASWYRGNHFEVVQMLYPDRSGLLPYEAGFDRKMVSAQPVIGQIE